MALRHDLLLYYCKFALHHRKVPNKRAKEGDHKVPHLCFGWKVLSKKYLDDLKKEVAEDKKETWYTGNSIVTYELETAEAFIKKESLNQNVVEIPLGSGGFSWIISRGVFLSEDVLLSVKSIVVNSNLGVSSEEFVISSHNERVDLDHIAITSVEGIKDSLEHV